MRSLVLLALCLAVACAGPTGAGGDVPDAPPKTAVPDAPPQTTTTAMTLENGGTVVGADGISLTAAADTLTAPIQVFIEPATVEVTALPEGFTVVGAYHRLGAEADVMVAAASSFELGLPIPAGADPTRLSVAVLRTADDILDVETPTFHWEILPGDVDPRTGRLVTSLPFLAATGRYFGLVEEHTAATSVRRRRAAATATATATGAFFVACIGFTNGGCDLPLIDEVVTFLRDAYADLHAMGYADPQLPPVRQGGINAGFEVHIRRSQLCPLQGDGAFPVQGYYDPELGRLNICVTDAETSLSDLKKDVLRHEYFHATQYGYGPVRDDWKAGRRERWLTEGTAKGAERSYGIPGMALSPTRKEAQLHPLDVSLLSTDEGMHYFTQDFWVFAALRVSQRISAWTGIFALGQTSDAIDQGLPGDNLADTYWAWARNYFIEKIIDYFPSDYTSPDVGGGGPCEPDFLSINYHQIIWYWGNIASDPELSGSLPPLSSTVVVIEALDVFPPSFTVEEILHYPEIRYRAYAYDHDTDIVPDCTAVPDGPNAFDPPSVTYRYAVLLSNTSPSVSRFWKLEVLPRRDPQLGPGGAPAAVWSRRR